MQNEEWSNSKEMDINSSPLQSTGKIERSGMTQSTIRTNQLQNKKAEQIRVFVQEKFSLMKRIIAQQDDEKLKSLFQQGQVWVDLKQPFRQTTSKSGPKLVRHPHRVFYGVMKQQKKNGRGVSVYEDGKFYEGFYLDNEKHGQGIQIYSNGNVYNGSQEHNKKHGYGEMYWLSLRTDYIEEYYVGEWWGGLPFGKGKHQRTNGDVYRGDFKNGLKHGQGEQFFANGDYYKGEYINGLPQGKGQYHWATDALYQGEFQQGVRSGFGRWKKQKSNQFSQTYQGTFVLDVKSGQGVYTWPQGKFYKGEFMNDKRHGFGQMYQGEDLKQRCFWQNGKPIKNNTQTQASFINPERSYVGQQFSMIYPRRRSHTRILTSKELTQKPQKLLNIQKLVSKQLGPLTRPVKTREYSSNKGMKHRVETQASNMPSIKEFGKISRPSSLIKLDMKTKRESFKRLPTYGGENLTDRKVSHRNCIPEFPWEKRGQKVLDKL